MTECHLSLEEKIVLREVFSYSDDSETMNMVAAILSISTSQEEEEEEEEEEDLLCNEDNNEVITVTDNGWSDDEYAVIKAYYENEEEEDWLEIHKTLGIVEESGQLNGEQKVTMEDNSRLTLKKYGFS